MGEITSQDHLSDDSVGKLYADISKYIRAGRNNVVHYVNHQMLFTYWMIGKRIIEEEQQGSTRATYGAELLKNLATKLVSEFGKGFSFPHLKNIRQFYIAYKNRIGYEPGSQSLKSDFQAKLSWTHYRTLMRVTDQAEQAFYEQEATRENWSTTELQRQISTKLFDRLTHAKTAEYRK